MKKKYRIAYVLLCLALLMCSCADSSSSSQGTVDETSSESTCDSLQSSPDESSSLQEESSMTDDSSQQESAAFKEKYSSELAKTKDALSQDTSFKLDESTVGKDIAGMYDFVNKSGCYPVYKGVDIDYYPMGDDALGPMLEELEKAENYIFLEYYTLNEGEMWDQIYAVLKKKAAAGVEVRVMYDWIINAPDLPADFPQQLEQNGIRCVPFSEAGGSTTLDYNIRDHRKIMIIDGKVAFTGGINIADAYINVTHEFGVWKDNVIAVKGSAVDSFTLMVLQLWNSCTGETEIDKYLTAGSETKGVDGYIMPFSENPYDEYLVGKSFYLSMLENASDYIYIITPYLIPDDEFEQALIDTAKRGVEVRIYVPGTSDLVVAGTMTKSHYRTLIDGGVRIFEYTPGFIHSKVFVSDDNKAIVGTINIDSRSFIYDFECGVYLYGKEAVADVLSEFTDHDEDYTEITPENVDDYTPAGGSLLKGLEGYF